MHHCQSPVRSQEERSGAKKLVQSTGNFMTRHLAFLMRAQPSARGFSIRRIADCGIETSATADLLVTSHVAVNNFDAGLELVLGNIAARSLDHARLQLDPGHFDRWVESRERQRNDAVARSQIDNSRTDFCRDKMRQQQSIQ